MEGASLQHVRKDSSQLWTSSAISPPGHIPVSEELECPNLISLFTEEIKHIAQVQQVYCVMI